MRNRAFAVVISIVVIAGMSLACHGKSGGGPTDPLALVVTTVFPNTGPIDGGMSVRISGAGFLPGATAVFDGVPAAVTSVTSNVIAATTPLHVAGLVDLVVTNPNGRSAALPHGFAYAAMSVSSATPNHGLPGTFVQVNGFGFQSTPTVSIDGAVMPAFFSNASTVFVIVPAHPPGPVNIDVTSPTGSQRATLANGFTFESMTITASTAVVVAGGPLSVSWVAPAGRDPFDWIGLFRVGDPNANFDQLWWQYTQGVAAGTKALTAPTQPGQYEFRYFVEDGLVDAARSGRVTVTGAGG